MVRYTSESIRNIALVGQEGSGKTTLVEKLAESAGVIGQAGKVEKGNTISDYNALEKSFGHSLSSSVISIDHNNIHLNIIDTPGMLDFVGQSMAVFPAVETVVVVINAATGVGTVSRRTLNWAAESNLCRMIIINHIDHSADLPALLSSIREEFGSECLPINLPASGGTGVVDCFFDPGGEADFSSVEEAHAEIVDQVVEMDEALMEQYLNSGTEPSVDALHEPFEKAMRDGHLVPVCFVSGMSGAGVPELLEVFERLMPNPLEGNPRPFLLGEGESAQPYTAIPDPRAHVVAHVFKVIADPFVGKLGLFRIHQGTITKDKQLFIGDGRKPFRVAHLLKLTGNSQQELEAGVPGDICAVAKIDGLHPDAVLHDSHEEDYLHMKPLPFPEPVFGLAVSASSRSDDQRLAEALERLVEEDPCLSLTREIEQNELVLQGLGELHLRMTLEQLKQRFNVDPITSPPRVPYRETISAPAEAKYRHKKQSGGAGQFGEVHMRLRPLERGEGFRFINEVKGGNVPSQFIPAVEKGVRQAMQRGIVAGYSIQDVEVTVHDGKHHPVDSKEVAFVAAGRWAFIKAARQAQPILLEPITSLDIQVPSDNLGAVTGDLLSRRGQLLSTTGLANGDQAIKAHVPLAELAEYSSRLNALTAGRGVFTMEFDHYEQAPGALQEQLAAEWTSKEDAD